MNQRPSDVVAKKTMTTRLFYRWADGLWLQLFVFVLLSLVSWLGYTQPERVTAWISHWVAQSSIDQEESPEVAKPLVIEGKKRKQPPPNVQPFQVAGDQCVLVVSWDEASEEDFFSRKSIAVIRHVVQGIEAMPQVRHLTWLNSIPDFNPFSLPGTLLPSPNASDRQIEASRTKVLGNPLAVGQLISADAKTLVIPVEIDWFFVTDDDEATTAIVQEARRLAREASDELRSDAKIQFQLTGRIPLHLMTARNHIRDSTTYQLVGYSIMLVSALILFRGFSAVIIVAVAPAVGVFWTNGMLHFFDLQDNPFNDVIVPILISLVGLTDSVHLMVEIRQQRANGHDTAEAARRGIARVGLACLLTSLTTAIGFISLHGAHHEIVRDFGWCCVVGVVMTFISVLTVIPLGCRSPLGRRLHIGMGKSLVDRQLRRIGPLVDFILKRDKGVARAAIVATLLFGVASLQLTPDEKRFSGLSESGEAAQAMRHLDRALGGLDSGSVNVSWSDEVAQGEVLEILRQTGEVLSQEPLIGHPLGVHDLLKALPGEGDPAERMTLLELLPPALKRAYYQPERNHAWVQFRVQDIGIAAYNTTFKRIEEKLVKVVDGHPNVEVSLEGDAVWRWRNIYQIVNDLAKSLGSASIVIWIVLTLVYRSIRIGLISIIPNLFPLAVTAAVLYFFGQHLEMVTVCVFTICVGIAVDDTIHFLTRYQEESIAGGDHTQVIRRAFTGVGSALLMTTIVLVAGMGSAILGDSRDARLFGIMGCLTLTAALFADILLLPALLSRFGRKGGDSRGSDSQV